MTKILWIPQLSFIQKNTSKFLLDEDSNMHFARRIFPVIHKTFPDWTIDLITPEFFDAPEFSHVDYVNKLKYTALFTPDAMLGRIYFPLDAWKTLLKISEPDIVFLNTPELVQNLTALREKMQLKFKIVTYNHWVELSDVPRVTEATSYIWRQTEGAVKSDMALFNSKYIIRRFVDSTLSNFGPQIREKLVGKIFPLYIPHKRRTFVKNKKVSSKVSVLWAQRLSENLFYKKDREYWFKIFNKYSDDVELSVSNPSGFDIANNTFKESGPWDHTEFLQKLANADLTFGPMQSPIQWSLNLTDSLEVNTPAFVLDKDAIFEMVQWHYPFASLSQIGLTRMFEELITRDRIWELREKSKNLSRYFAFDDATIREQLLKIEELL